MSGLFCLVAGWLCHALGLRCAGLMTVGYPIIILTGNGQQVYDNEHWLLFNMLIYR